MKNSIIFFVVMISLTGCKFEQAHLVNEANLPGRQFEFNAGSNNINDPHSLTRTKKGVYVYKDNVQYNVAGTNNFGKTHNNSARGNSAMGEIKFGPKDI